MIYRPFGNTGVQLSAIGLGGHEYLPNGSSRGFNEDRKDAVKPGYVGAGYGGPEREHLLGMAFESGVNFLDVTIDPEKEALGRNLRTVKPPHEVFVQTRPEGMGYSYDPGNRKMADADLLRAEVERVLTLLQRDRIDILNFPFLQSALDEDPDYLVKIQANVADLKSRGLIRFASADNFSGGATYLTQMESGIFDSITMNFSFANDAPLRRVIPDAQAREMGVITREVFQKGTLWTCGEEASISNRARLARLSLKWSLSVSGVTTVLVGARNVDELSNALSVVDDPAMSEDDDEVLKALTTTPSCVAYRDERTRKFQGES